MRPDQQENPMPLRLASSSAGTRTTAIHSPLHSPVLPHYQKENLATQKLNTYPPTLALLWEASHLTSTASLPSAKSAASEFPQCTSPGWAKSEICDARPLLSIIPTTDCSAHPGMHTEPAIVPVGLPSLPARTGCEAKLSELGADALHRIEQNRMHTESERERARNRSIDLRLCSRWMEWRRDCELGRATARGEEELRRAQIGWMNFIYLDGGLWMTPG